MNEFETAIEKKGLNNRHMVFKGALAIRLFMSLTSLGISVSLPVIVKSLEAVGWYSLVVVLYNTVQTVASCLGGKLGDLFGRKKIIIAAVTGIAAGEIICALSPSLTFFIVGYLVIALGYGMALPMPIALICDVSNLTERPRYMGIFTSIHNVGMLLGPVVGGLISDNLGFRFTPVYPIPIGIIAIFLIWRYYPDRPENRKMGSIDYRGIILLALSIGPIVIGLNLGGSVIPWGSPLILGLMAAAIIFTFVFLANESKAKEPFLPLKLFKIRSFTTASVMIPLIIPYTVIYSSYINLFAQNGLGVSVTVSGSLALPKTTLVILITVALSSWIARHRMYQKYMILSCGVIVAATQMVLSLGAQSSSALLFLYVCMGAYGISESLYYMALQPYLQSELPENLVGVGVSVQYFFTMIGVSLTSAIFGAVLNSFGGNINAAFPIMCLITAATSIAFLLIGSIYIKSKPINITTDNSAFVKNN